MIDMSQTIQAKSDQLNADDLHGVTINAKITNVSRVDGDQPIAINYEGDNNKPYKPCKSMRRIMVQAWGADGSKYVGQTMTLYRDENVKWAGQAVGGIRISHMTGINKKMVVVLAESQKNRKPYTVLPLIVEESAEDKIKAAAKRVIAEIKKADSEEHLKDVLNLPDMTLVENGSDKAYKHVKDLYNSRMEQLAPTDDIDIDIESEKEELPV